MYNTRYPHRPQHAVAVAAAQKIDHAKAVFSYALATTLALIVSAASILILRGAV